MTLYRYFGYLPVNIGYRLGRIGSRSRIFYRIMHGKRFIVPHSRKIYLQTSVKIFFLFTKVSIYTKLKKSTVFIVHRLHVWSYLFFRAQQLKTGQDIQPAQHCLVHYGPFRVIETTERQFFESGCVRKCRSFHSFRVNKYIFCQLMHCFHKALLGGVVVFANL